MPENKTELGAWLLADKITESALLNLSLRDLFAAFALAGIMAMQKADETNPRWTAAHSYDLADAMLAQRKEVKP